MPRGFDIPFRVESGRAIMVEGTDQLSKIIILNLLEGDSANPFLDIGVATGVIFDMNDQAVRARINSKIRRLFTRLKGEGRADLAAGFPVYETDSDNQLLICHIRFIDLESTKQEEISIGFATALSPSTVRIQQWG